MSKMPADEAEAQDAGAIGSIAAIVVMLLGVVAVAWWLSNILVSNREAQENRDVHLREQLFVQYGAVPEGNGWSAARADNRNFFYRFQDGERRSCAAVLKGESALLMCDGGLPVPSISSSASPSVAPR